MNKKKVLLSVVALLLVCALSVAGTLALLKLQAPTPVTNTFIAAGGGKLANNMLLSEHLVAPNANGDYQYAKKDNDGNIVLLNSSTGADFTTENQYTVMPGMNVPKDPMIEIYDKTDAPAYLILEVISDLPDGYFTLDSRWHVVKDQNDAHATGIHGGKLYCYKGTVNTDTGSLLTYNIIADNRVTIPDGDTLMLKDNAKLEFYAYLAQANAGSMDDPLDAYFACFDQPANP